MQKVYWRSNIYHLSSCMKVFMLLSLFSIVILSACSSNNQEQKETPLPMTKVKLITTKGNIVLKLYNETAKHRENFVKLVQEGAYDSIVFHRAIRNFIIQAGDMSSRISRDEQFALMKNEHEVQAEFDRNLFHKRGTIGAARDDNPKLASSGTHFFINIGQVQTDSLIDKYETLINKDKAFYYRINLPENKTVYDRYISASEIGEWEELKHLKDSLKALESGLDGYQPYQIPEHHREVYKTVGGNPFHDQRYVVFGEVVEGMEIVDSISVTEVDKNDWPIEDVRILSAKIIK